MPGRSPRRCDSVGSRGGPTPTPAQLLLALFRAMHQFAISATGENMAGLKASKAQMLDLLNRLASDDDFRADFEKNPALALSQIGLPADQVKVFLADHIVTGKLANKAEFETARKRINGQDDAECLCMIIPGIKLDFRAYK
ncbi:MAG: NHLP-related RiPP peptide [Rudaea sp.]